MNLKYHLFLVLIVFLLFISGCSETKVGEIKNGIIDCGKWDVTKDGISNNNKSCFIEAFNNCQKAKLETYTNAGQGITYSQMLEITGLKSGKCYFIDEFRNTNENGRIIIGKKECTNLQENFSSQCEFIEGPSQN